MSDPYLGQIEAFAFGFAPKNWSVCAGQLLPISQNQALFSLLGTTYGGNGTTTFALPDLRGCVAIGQGNGPGAPPYQLGNTGGEENHTLVSTEIPPHNHMVNAISNPAVANNTYTPDNTTVLAQTAGVDQNGNPIPFNVYGSTPLDATLAPTALDTSGGQPHSNMMPYLAVNFCIAMTGIYPSRD